MRHQCTWTEDFPGHGTSTIMVNLVALHYSLQNGLLYWTWMRVVAVTRWILQGNGYFIPWTDNNVMRSRWGCEDWESFYLPPLISAFAGNAKKLASANFMTVNLLVTVQISESRWLNRTDSATKFQICTSTYSNPA